MGHDLCWFSFLEDSHIPTFRPLVTKVCSAMAVWALFEGFGQGAIRDRIGLHVVIELLGCLLVGGDREHGWHEPSSVTGLMQRGIPRVPGPHVRDCI